MNLIRSSYATRTQTCLAVLAMGFFTACGGGGGGSTPIPAPTVTDVYVTYSESNGTHYIAKVWKNGVTTSLTDGSNNADSYGMGMSGSDLYIAGDEQNGTNYVADDSSQNELLFV